MSVVDKVVDKKGTRKQAEAYLKYLWSPTRRRRSPPSTDLRPRYADRCWPSMRKTFPKVNTFTVDEVFGGWTKAQKEHFDDGAHLRPDPGGQPQS